MARHLVFVTAMKLQVKPRRKVMHNYVDYNQMSTEFAVAERELQDRINRDIEEKVLLGGLDKHPIDRQNGRGYPKGLKGVENIANNISAAKRSLQNRIQTVISGAYDALDRYDSEEFGQGTPGYFTFLMYKYPGLFVSFLGRTLPKNINVEVQQKAAIVLVNALNGMSTSDEPETKKPAAICVNSKPADGEGL